MINIDESPFIDIDNNNEINNNNNNNDNENNNEDNENNNSNNNDNNNNNIDRYEFNHDQTVKKNIETRNHRLPDEQHIHNNIDNNENEESEKVSNINNNDLENRKNIITNQSEIDDLQKMAPKNQEITDSDCDDQNDNAVKKSPMGRPKKQRLSIEIETDDKIQFIDKCTQNSKEKSDIIIVEAIDNYNIEPISEILDSSKETSILFFIMDNCSLQQFVENSADLMKIYKYCNFQTIVIHPAIKKNDKDVIKTLLNISLSNRKDYAFGNTLITSTLRSSRIKGTENSVVIPARIYEDLFHDLDQNGVEYNSVIVFTSGLTHIINVLPKVFVFFKHFKYTNKKCRKTVCSTYEHQGSTSMFFKSICFSQ